MDPQCRLVAAARLGDFPAAIAALADGANVHDAASDGTDEPQTPLAAAAVGGHLALAVHLITLGASPNDGSAVWHAALLGSGDMLQLLVDAGGGVNGDGVKCPPLLAVVRSQRGNVEDAVRVLLAQPSLDLTVSDVEGSPTEDGGDYRWSADALACKYGMRHIGDLIFNEVRLTALGSRLGWG